MININLVKAGNNVIFFVKEFGLNVNNEDILFIPTMHNLKTFQTPPNIKISKRRYLIAVIRQWFSWRLYG